MSRSTVSWETDIKASERYRLSTHVLYGDLYYQTPGGLTLAQYTANPKAARPAGGGFPSAQQVNAAIYQKTLWAGINQQYIISEHWQNSTSVYGAFTLLEKLCYPQL
jgi:iron complex outermembrane receptor protein